MMKRSAREEKEFFVYPVQTWPVFIWTLCEACQSEFRREWGWHWIVCVDSFLAGEGYTLKSNVCHECLPTWEEARRWFNDKHKEVT